MSSSLGGLSRIFMSVAPREAALIPTQLEFREVNFLVSRSSYVQCKKDDAIKHRLVVAVYADYSPLENEGLDRGFVARIVLDWGEEIVVGYNSKSGYDRALRLVESSLGSGDRLFERPVKILTFECLESV